MENIILIDWLALTFRGGDGQSDWTVSEIIDFLQLKKQIDFQELPGRYHYRNRVSFGNIHIYYNSMKPDTNFPMLELTGQGCREFETFSELGLTKLVELCSEKPKLFHVVRIDIAYDDHIGVLDIMKACKDGYERNFISVSTNARIIDDIKGLLDGLSISFGSKSSDIYLRIYDKAIERKYTDGRHWIRCELMLKQDRAAKFLKNSEPLGVKFRGVIHNYLRFVTPSKTDSNKRRWKMRKYWSDFLDGAEKISLYTKKDIDYNLSFLHRYVFNQAGNSVFTYIQCVGVTAFLEELLGFKEDGKMKDRKLNVKQKYLIQQCKLLCDSNETITKETIDELEKNYKYGSEECKSTVKQFNEDYAEFSAIFDESDDSPPTSAIFDENGEYLALP